MTTAKSRPFRWPILVFAFTGIFALLPGITLAQVSDTPQIHLQYGTFDPLEGEPLFQEEQSSSSSLGQSSTYLLQFIGPVQESWKAAVEGTGVRLYTYIPDYAFIVRLDAETKELVSDFPFVRWVGPFHPVYRLAPTLQNSFTGQVGSEPLSLLVQTLPGVDLDYVVSQVKSMGAKVQASSKNDLAGYLRLDLPPELLSKLSALTGVLWIEPYFQPQLFNDVGGENIMNADTVRTSLGLYGSGQIVGVADTGLDVGYNDSRMSDDFEGRILSGESICAQWGTRDSWNDIYGHGTHVSGSVLGNGVYSGSKPDIHQYAGTFAGVAPEAQLVFQSIGDVEGKLCVPLDIESYLFTPAYNGGSRIHTNSWGGATGDATNPYGGYTIYSRQTDSAAWKKEDMLILFAAGNEGKDANENGVVDLDSLASPGTAKNIITVGASENYRPDITTTWGYAFPDDNWVDPIFSDYIGDNSNGMAAFSSRGPADDYRIKPDLVAPGTLVISARSHDPNAGAGWGVVNDHYVYNGGTSMATPLTAGAAALVREWLTDIRGFLNPSAALMKAVLINGAVDMSPGQYASPQEIPAQRPNSVTGWGRVDLAASLKPPAPQKIWLKDYAAGLGTGKEARFIITLGQSQNNTSASGSNQGFAGQPQNESILVSPPEMVAATEAPSPQSDASEPVSQPENSEAIALDEIDEDVSINEESGVEQIIHNGGFESDGDWTFLNTQRTSAQFHSGSWSAASIDPSSGAFYQMVSFPSDAVSATLSYYWKNTNPDVDFDFLQVYVLDETNSVVYGYGPEHSASDTSWHNVNLGLDPILDAIKGQTDSVYFYVNKDGSVPEANFYVDDVALQVDTPDFTIGGPFRITLAWTDYPGSTIASKALVNDLDLEVIAPDGKHYYGNTGVYSSGHTCLRESKWDRCNNVEGVLIPKALNGTYTVIVHGYNIPSGPQPFALVASGDYLGEEINYTYLPLIMH